MAVDLRYGWMRRRDLEASLLVRTPFDLSQPKWVAPGKRTEIERAAFLKILWQLR